MSGLVVDNFAGGGGASLGIEQAIGRPVDVAINHDRHAVAMHEANHPRTRHYQQDIWSIDPREVCAGAPVDLAWFSPDCTHHSKARGGKPVEKGIRDLAWVVALWAATVRPAVMMLENVEEFRAWGPLDDANMPVRERRGETFGEFVAVLRELGYEVQWRELRACDYGAPTIRKRLFMVARCDGGAIVWPAPTHGKPGSWLTPYRTAAECIDWSIPCPSIFERPRPLAEATLRRIANGLRRYVIEARQPFIVRNGHWSHRSGEGFGFRGQGVDEPLATVTGTNEFNVVTPYLVGITHNQAGDGFVAPADVPMRTVTASRGGEEALVAPLVVRMNHAGQGKPADGLDEPLRTVTTQHNKHELVAAFLAKHFGGNGSPGAALELPLATVTAKERFALVVIDGEPYRIVDIGMRMLTPRELFRAQGFPEGYVIDPEVGGRRLSKTAQVRMCGNSVCPDAARALVEANVGRLGQQSMWRGYELPLAAAGGAS